MAYYNPHRRTPRCFFGIRYTYFLHEQRPLKYLVLEVNVWSKDTIIFQRLGQIHANPENKEAKGMFTSGDPNPQICFCGCLLFTTTCNR